MQAAHTAQDADINQASIYNAKCTCAPAGGLYWQVCLELVV